MRRLGALVALALADAGPAQAVNALTAEHRHGQTFLTWTQGGTASRYRVYRAEGPIDSANLGAATWVGDAQADSSANVRLNTIANPADLGSDNRFRIASNATPLGADQGLFVLTTTATRTSWYAVTELVGGVEQTTLVAGQNATLQPLQETPGAPQPVWQRNYVAFGRSNEIYVHWAGAADHPDYPAMANVASVPFNFALNRRGTQPPHPLVVRFHFKGGNFLSLPFGTQNTNEWLLMLDDWLPNLRNRDTFWYGYHEGFDIHGDGGAVPTSGSVPDYTVRRVRWTLDWVLGQGAIDTDRIYMTGSSMGGIGAFFISMVMPERVAAIFATVPKFDFSFLGDPNPGSQWNADLGLRAEGERLWGAVASNLPASEGLGIYDRLNAGKLAEVFAARSMPVMHAYNGRHDVVVGWAEKIPFYAALQQHRHGGYFFWDTRTHGGTPGYVPEWTPQEQGTNAVNEHDGVNVLNLYRLDQSYPAFAHASADHDPGAGLAGDGDPVGTLNGHLRWERASIVDTPSRWEIGLALQDLLIETAPGVRATLPAPATVAVDVTPRRLQHFVVRPFANYAYANTDGSGHRVASGIVAADALGLVTVPGFVVSGGGNYLTLVPDDPLFADGFESP